ncbi:MAG: PsbP-related protein [Chitinophagaceae bacterium]
MKQLLLIIFSMAGLCSAPAKAGQMLFFHYTKEGYSISYPETWRIDTSGSLMNIPLFLFAPKDAPEDSVFENLHIAAQPLNGQEMDLGSMLAPSVKEYSGMFNGFKLIDSAVTTIDGKPAALISFVYNPGSMQLRMITTYVKGKDKLFMINVTAEEHNYLHYAATFDAIIRSFHTD